MKRLTATQFLLATFAATALVGCGMTSRFTNSRESQLYMTQVKAANNSARVIILPTHSTGMYSDLHGKANIDIFPDGSDRGRRIGTTTESTYIAFNVGPGIYDIQASASRIAHFVQSETFEAGKVYFFRPSFFKSAKEMHAYGETTSGMRMVPVDQQTAESEMSHMTAAAITAPGQQYLASTIAQPQQQRTRYAPPAYTPPAYAPSPQPAAAPAPAAPSYSQPAAPSTATQDQRQFSVIEQKLKNIRRLLQENLITQSEYETKRQAILNSY